MPNFIENEAAYEAAIRRNIHANAIIGKRKRFFAVPANKALFDEVRSVLYIDYGIACGEFEGDGYHHLCWSCEDKNNLDGCGIRSQKQNPKAPVFLWKMDESFSEWGSWSDNQMAAIRKVIDGMEEREAKFAAEKAKRAAASEWVGEIGQRSEFDLEVVRVSHFEGQYGFVYVHSMVDGDGNEFVHMGVPIVDKSIDSYPQIAKGDRVKIKASIKAHSEYEGVKQSKLSRPVLISIERAELND